MLHTQAGLVGSCVAGFVRESAINGISYLININFKFNLQMKDILFLVLAGVLGFSCSSRGSAPKKSPLYVGASVRNITPADSLFPFQGPHESRPYVGVHDSLYIRVVVLDNGAKRVVFAEMDEVSVPDHESMNAIAAHAADVSASDVVICSSHTHSTLHPGPELQDHLAFVKRQLRTAVSEAVRALQPATVSFHRTSAFANVNNGELNKGGAQYDEDSFSDKTLDIIGFRKRDGSPYALILNYSSHAEVMFRSVTKEGGYEISGDLPGRVAEIMRRYGWHVVLTTAGAEGDQQPLYTSSARTYKQGFVDQGEHGWAVLDVLAGRIADKALLALEDTSRFDREVALGIRRDTLYLPGQRYDRKTGKARDTEDVAMPIAGIRLNDMAIFAVAADLAAGIGADVRRASPVSNTMLVTMMGGSVGYVLDDEAYKEPGHGAMGSKVKPGHAGNELVKGIKKILDYE